MANFTTKLFIKLTSNEEGASAIEYAILAAVIAGGIVTISGTIGGQLSSLFSNLSTKIGLIPGA